MGASEFELAPQAIAYNTPNPTVNRKTFMDFINPFKALQKQSYYVTVAKLQTTLNAEVAHRSFTPADAELSGFICVQTANETWIPLRVSADFMCFFVGFRL